MGALSHLGRKQEMIECERMFNIILKGSKSSMLCYYHDKDFKALDSTTNEQTHKFHLKNYVVKKQE